MHDSYCRAGVIFDLDHGTLMFIGQPAEERVGGARAMLDDRLYERFGRPDYCIAQQDNPEVAAGQVAVVARRSCPVRLPWM